MNEDSVQRLGVAVGQTYCEAIASLASLIDAHLADPPRLEAETATLKEEVINTLVRHGRDRAALTADERIRVDAITATEIQRVDAQAWQTMSRAIMTLMFTQHTLSQTLSSFNVITQYAAFELLRAQHPDEADRLGLP